MSKFSVNYDDIWEEVDSKDFVNVTPTNEHDRHSVKRIIALIQAAQDTIDNHEQLGLDQARIQALEDKVRQMKEILVEECKIASRVDSAVPRLRRRGH